MRVSRECNRPLLRYHGGKWRMAPWIISHFPEHKIYVEPYGGAASVLLRKTRSKQEIYNDIDREIINVFKIMRDKKKAKKLIKLIELTPYSRYEFNLSYIKVKDPIERARRTIVRSFMGYSSDSSTRNHKTGFRYNHGSHTLACTDWMNLTRGLERILKRMQGIIIEEIPGLECIKKYDTDETLFYIDPPYLPETRYMKEKTKTYTKEMNFDEHVKLLLELLNIKGMVVLSGFDSVLYNRTLINWKKSEKKFYGQSGKGSKLNKECLWLSPNIKNHLPLFGGS